MTDDESPQDAFAGALAQCIKAISTARKCDVFMYAGPINNGYETRMMQIIKALPKRRESAMLLLETYGGHADAAYKIARAFQRHYKHFIVLIDRDCKSAGTLLCTGADEICMGDNAELGPLDVQMPKEGEFSARRSGLEIYDTLNALQQESVKLMRTHFLELRVGSGTQITTKDALKNATKLVCGLMSPLYEQISPLSLGEAGRSNLVALQYGKRLSSERETMHPDGLARLISAYPSHGFVIDRAEANDLFINVTAASDWEEILGPLLRREHEELAERTSPLITCLTDDYNCSLTSEEPAHELDAEAIDAPNDSDVPDREGQRRGDGAHGAANGASRPSLAKRPRAPRGDQGPGLPTS